MEIGSSPADPRSRGPFPLLIGLTALAGFVAGACLVGLTKFLPGPLPRAAQTDLDTSTRPASPAPAPRAAVFAAAPDREPVITPERGPAVAPAPWPFESATPGPPVLN